MLFILLTGNIPFKGMTVDQVIGKITKNELNLNFNVNVNDDLRNFIKLLLNGNKKYRP